MENTKVHVYDNLNNINTFTNKKGVVFAMYSKKQCLDKNVIKYLSALKTESDFVIVVADNYIYEKELPKLSGIADYYIFCPHGEYDFGSYKRGFEEIIKHGLSDKIDDIVFCNDSVKFLGSDLNDIFRNIGKHSFYGITQNYYGYDSRKNNYHWIKSPHIQSYFFSVNKNIFNENYFREFMSAITREVDKLEIINKYECGLSKLITSKGHSMNSYYPMMNKNVVPCDIYLKQKSSYHGQKFFIKKSFSARTFNKKIKLLFKIIV